MQERVLIIIDGSNFYHRLKELWFSRILHFGYQRFEAFLIGHHRAVRKGYYIGAVREESNNLKSKELMKNQKILLSILRKCGWETRLGHLLKTTKYQEKGVDVMMVIDMLVGAYEDSYDRVILVSSGTDLIPAIQKVRSMGKMVEYVGFRHKPSFGIMKNADEKRLLSKDELRQFIPG